MQVIILAAGRGVRLGKQAEGGPKTLVWLKDKPLCHHILDSLNEFNLDRVFVVGGYQFEKLDDQLKPYTNEISMIRNTNFDKGNLLSLLVAKDRPFKSFSIMNADHLYSRTILRKIFSRSRPSLITAVCDYDRNLNDDDMKVCHHSDGTLQKMDKRLSSFNGGYIGITIVPQEQAGLYWKTADKVLKDEGENACVESVLNRIAGQGNPVRILDVSGSIWFEVDTPEDLRRAKQLINRDDFSL